MLRLIISCTLGILLLSGCKSTPPIERLGKQLDLQRELELELYAALESKYFTDIKGKKTPGFYLRKDGAVHPAGTLVDFNNPNSLIDGSCATGSFPDIGIPLSSIQAKITSSSGFKIEPDEDLANAFGIMGSKVELINLKNVSVAASEVQQYVTKTSLSNLQQQILPCMVQLGDSIVPSGDVGVVRGYVSAKYTISNVVKFDFEANVNHSEVGTFEVWWNDGGEFFITDSQPRKLPILAKATRFTAEKLENLTHFQDDVSSIVQNAPDDEKTKLIDEIIRALSRSDFDKLRNGTAIQAYIKFDKSKISNLQQIELLFKRNGTKLSVQELRSLLHEISVINNEA